jgi:hypothetical protein
MERGSTRSSRGERPPITVALIVGAVALVAALALALASRPGLVVSPDSVAYLDSAHNLRAGHGLELSASYPNLEPLIRGRHPFPLIHWAPLYPATLAAGSKLAGGELTAARWLMVLTLAGNVALFGLVLWRLSGRSEPVTVLGTVALALSPVGLPLHRAALSEPLFLLLSIGGFELLARYLLHGGTRRLLWAGALLVLALLTRYAGLPLMGATFLGLLVYGAGGIRTRLLRASVFCAAIAVPLVGWVIRNLVEAGTATGRGGPIWHPPSSPDVRDGIAAVTEWFAPAALPAAARLLTAAAVVGVLAVGFRGLRRAGALSSERRPERDVRTALLLSFALLYLAFLAVSKLFLDSANPVDARGFAPAYVALALCAIPLIGDALAAARHRGLGRAQVALAAGTALIGLAYIQQSGAAARDLSRATDGYRAKQWRRSETVRALRSLPPRVLIYSNAPEAVYLLAGRRAETVPVRVDPLTDRPLARYRAALERERSRLRKRPGVVAFFEDVHRRYLPSEEEVARRLGVRVVVQAADGAVYARRRLPLHYQVRR